MKALQEIQIILDRCLLPRGILSGHIRRNTATAIVGGGKINNDAYVTYRAAPPGNKVYGNGIPILRRAIFNVNYYYATENNSNVEAVEAATVVDEIQKAFREAGWFITSGIMDLYDNDTGFEGFNIGVAKTEAV